MKHNSDARWPLVHRRSCWQARRVRTVPIPAWAKTAIDAWTTAAGIGAGYLFRPVNRGDQVCGDRLSEIVVWQMLKAYVAEIGIPNPAPHDLRRYADDPIMPNLCKDERTMEANEDARILHRQEVRGSSPWCSKSVPKVHVLHPKRLLSSAEAGSLNWCKAMQTRGNHGSRGERRASSHAGGPGFESLRAHHLLSKAYGAFERSKSRLVGTRPPALSREFR